jgi:hypothetical protein
VSHVSWGHLKEILAEKGTRIPECEGKMDFAQGWQTAEYSTQRYVI